MQYQAVKEVLGSNCILYSIDDYENYQFRSKEVLVYHRYEGMTRKREKELINIIKKNEIDTVYIDNSFWGFLVEKIKKYCHCRVIIFCQDIEYSRVSSIIDSEKKEGRYLKVLWHQLWKWTAGLNEKKAVSFADDILTLNKRDSKCLENLYGRKSTMEIPVCLKTDIPDQDKFRNPYKNEENVNLLLVGTMDYQPNVEAVKFMVEQVMPFLKHAVLNIVGKNSESLRTQYESQNVEIIGEVELLEPYYLYADAVVIPLFSGGGMKIKTAEALKYGKYVLGTKEAFEGYEVDYTKAGAICGSSVEFIEAVKQLDKKRKFNEYSRNYFLQNHSFESLKNRYADLFGIGRES